MPTTAKRLLTHARARRGADSPIAATDGELLMCFRRSGDREALAQILDRHAPMVWGVCRNVLHREQDAQDAFQATFLILLRRADSIRANDSAAGWLYRVALRAACDLRRTRLRRREEPLDAEPPQPEPAFPDIQRRQLATALMEELRALPDKYQVPLVMRYLEGLSRREIADQLDTTVAGVQGRLVRGKRQLRSRLIRRGVSLSVAMGVLTAGRPAEAAQVGPLLSSGGAAAAFSPIVQQLTLSGVRSMLIAAYAKPVAVVATLVIAAAVVTADEKPVALASTPMSTSQLELDITPNILAAQDALSVAVEHVQANSPEANRVEAEKLRVTEEEQRQYAIEGLMRDPFGPRLARDEAEWYLDRGLGDPSDPRTKLLKKFGAEGHEGAFLQLFKSDEFRKEPSLDRRMQLVAAEMDGKGVGPAVHEQHAPQQELVDFYRQLAERVRALHEAGAPGGDSASLAAAERAYSSALADLHKVRGEQQQAIEQYQRAVEHAQRSLQAHQATFDAGRVTLDVLLKAAEQRAQVKQKLLEAQQAAQGESTGAQSTDATPEQLDLQLQHWQLREQALKLRAQAAAAMAEEQQRVREKVANSIQEHRIQNQQAMALQFQAELREAQAKVLEKQRKVAEQQVSADRMAPAPPSAPTPPSAAPLAPPAPIPTAEAVKLMKQQLDLELNHWQLKAKALQLQAKAIQKEADQGAVARARLPGSVSGNEIEKQRADALMMQADSLQAQAKAVELRRKMAELREAAVPISAPAPPAAPGTHRDYPMAPTAPAQPPAPAEKDIEVYYFGAADSMPDQRMQPLIERLEAIIDVNRFVYPRDSEEFKRYGVTRTPTCTIVVNGEEKGRFHSVASLMHGISFELNDKEAAALFSVSEQSAEKKAADAVRRRLEEQSQVIVKHEDLKQRLEAMEKLVRTMGIGLPGTSVEELRDFTQAIESSRDPKPGGNSAGVEDELKQGNWRMFHEPSQLDPKGWAVIADLRVGDHMPVLVRDDSLDPGPPRPNRRPYLKLVRLAENGPKGDQPGLMSVVDPGRHSNGSAVNLGGEANQVLIRGQRCEIRELGPGQAPGSKLILVRGVQGRTEEELEETLPSVEEALQVLYEKRGEREQLAQLREQAEQLKRQRDQLQQQVERAVKQAEQAKQEAEQQRAVAMEQAEQAANQAKRLREELDKQRQQLEQQSTGDADEE